MKRELTNWNNYPKRVVDVRNWQGSSRIEAPDKYIARGMGRCYGDASIGDLVFDMLKHNLILSFDAVEGLVKCQSGVVLQDLLEVFVPRGWFLPVTPGTKFISVGGALASDVHGKNHHVAGCFGDHVTEVTLILPNGECSYCGPEQNSRLFNATRGGMGLTGVIDTVTFRLVKIDTSYIKQRQIKAKNLKEIMSLFEENQHATYSMAWIDCLKGGDAFGRSILMLGEHASIEDLSSSEKSKPLIAKKGKNVTMPFNLGSFVLNKASISAFNMLYYHKNLKKIQDSIVHYDGFFYPLDSIHHWNRMYGKSGFVQYQFVIPLENSEHGLTEILNKIREKGWGSFLAVLKLFGDQESFMSFPMKGYTLALDFPIKKGLFEFLDELDLIVASNGGRIYLSKDARMKSNMFTDNYPNANEFLDMLKELNASEYIGSDLSKRLQINI